MTVSTVDEGHGFAKGQKVKVRNDTGNTLRGKWTVQSVSTNDAGAVWVNVYGGTPQKEKQRSFPLERVEVIPEKRRRRRNGAETA